MADKAQKIQRCPKCAHEQTNQEECERCGLLFAKFERTQDRRQERITGQDERPPRGGGVGSRLVSALLLVVVTASLTYYLVGSDKQEKSTPVPAASPDVVADQGAKVSPPQVVRTVPPPAGPAPAVSKGNPIEQAKNGTVAIETPEGQASGFFINDTTIVTNKHVVAPDRNHLDEFRHKVETRRKLLSLEQERIAELRRRVQQLEDGPTRRQLLIIIPEREKELAQVLPLQEKDEVKLQKMERPVSASDIKIFLIDGSELSVYSFHVSSGHDLAILKVYSAKPTVLRPASKHRIMHQGDRVYAIGNPVGLRHTVTSGIFSGYRQLKVTNEVYLQIDAPINPGNSGGPLIDERGLVIGVNTIKHRDAEGVGFAIPIQKVFEEFSLNLGQTE